MMRKVIAFLAAMVPLAFLVFLVSEPVSNDTQLFLALVSIGGMIAFWPARRWRPARYMFLGLGSVIVLRYLYWRTTHTLPPVSQVADFSAGVVLYGAELFCILMFFITLFIVADPLNRRPAPRPRDEDLPSVDVFVPSYNEDETLLAMTLAAAKAMDYPAEKLTVYLLDDGGTDQKCMADDPRAANAARQRRKTLSALAEELGVVYIARDRNVAAKAGNLNYGLQRSSGDLIVVFDADHAPVAEFLRETVGHFFEDPKLFLVQTPHVFLNPDPVEKNLGTWAKMPSENEQFYSVVQRGLDKWNAAFFCGSGAVLSRRALEEVGGFSGITITEDCETALELHARGWTSRYVDKPLIAGLQPETFASFIGQRSRWCRGMMQILILKNPLFRRGLHLPQRIGYLSSSLFWLFPFPRLIFVLAPLMFIFFDLKIFVANVSDFMSYTVTSMAVSIMLQNYLFGRVRWPWVSELYEYVQSFFLAPAILSVIRNPRRPTFNVTAKGLTLEKDHFSEFAMPFVVAFAVLLLASIVAFGRIYAGDAQSDLMVVVAVWNTFNLVIAATAIGVVAERRERRRAHRLNIHARGILEVGSRRIEVLIEDASQGGVRLRPVNGDALHIERSMRVGALTVFHGAEGGDGPAIPVAIRRMISNAGGLEIGVEFFGLRAAHYAVIARLLYGSAMPIAEFRNRRRAGKSIFFGSAEFIGWSMREILRSLRLLSSEVKEHRRELIAENKPHGAGPDETNRPFETPQSPRVV